jgi:hypothetical protein
MSNRCGKKYRPSNSDEGFWFIDKFCRNCIHGKYEHTQNPDDNPCEILSQSFFNEAAEWVYGEDDKPTCTAWKKWDWGFDDDGNIIDPPPQFPDDPNQLCLPFIFDELEIKQHETEESSYVNGSI